MSFQRDFLSKRISDPLAKKIHDLGQEEFAQNFQVQNIDTLNVQILSIKTKTKTLSKDKFHVSTKSYSSDQRFYNAVYPDRNKLKLWIKGENSDKLHDYSLLNHNAHLWSPYQVAEQYMRDDPDNMAGHEIVSYANSTHYVHVADSPDLRITDLIVNEPTRAGFTILTRFNPLGIGKSKQDSRIIDQKIDSSQNRYGHSINIDENGDIYFYVKYNYRQYFAKLENPIIISLFEANYQVANFKSKNYKTETKIVAEEFINDSYDLACEFIYSTKECIIKLLYNGQIIASASSLTGTNSLPPNLQVHLPLQEGKWSETKTLPNNLPMNQVFDSSSNAVIGTINNPTTAIWNADNTFSNPGSTGGPYVTTSTNTPMNALTEFTMSFWFNPLDELVPTATREIVNKGVAVANTFRIYRDTSVNNLRFVIYNTGASDFTSLTFSNPFPTANTWYFICAKWKTGEKLKLSINNGTDVLSSTTLAMTISNVVSNVQLYRSTNCAKGTILNLMAFNRQITAAEQTQLFNYGPHTAQFPTNLEPQRLPNPAPVAVTNPINTIYDLQPLPSPTAADYVYINNPSSQNPFVAKYDAPDGVVSAIPEATIYNINPGTGGTTTVPFATPYTLPGASSTGQIAQSDTASSNEWGYVQYVLINTSVLYNQKFTEISVDLNGLDNPVGGSIYLGIIKNDGTKIKFGAAIDPATLPDAWTTYTRQLLTNVYPLALDDGIGVIWEGGTDGSVNIRRGGLDVHFDKDASGNPRSCQGGRRGAGIGEWKTPNEDWSMAGVLKTGGGTTGTSPYYDMKNATGFYILVGEYFPTGSPMIGEIPTYASFRVWREAAATDGTVSIRHVKADGTYWATLYEVNVSTLPTVEPTTFNFVWTNFDYTRAIIAGDRIAVVVNGQTTGLVKVLTNIGNNAAGNSYDTTRSILNMRNFAGTFSSATQLDLAGVIKKGGSSFTPIIKFSATITRIYERCVNASSSFYDQPLSRILIRGKRTGTIPSPSLMTCTLKNSANADKATIGTYDANSISTSAYQDVIFTNNNNDIKVAPGDYVSIALATCDATNFIELNMTKNIDAGNSIMGTLDAGVITDLASFDLAGKFYIGGQVDNISRKRVAQYIDTQDSIFLTVPNNRVTIVDVILSAVGAPSGLVYFNIRRGSDDALIFNLGSVSAGTITTALTGTPVHITNFNNTYILAAKDKLSIEYENGDQLNKIGVHVRTVEPSYDGVNSYIARHNGIEYDYMNTKDLVATMKVGGDTYMPEANAPPPVLPQNPTDLYLLAHSSKKETSYLRCIFGMYLFFHTVLTDQELINFNVTRIDTGDNPPNQIQCTNHSFFRSS